jgi:outer membrane lipoprotein carrier protein
MKLIIFLLIFNSLCFASIDKIDSFEADFTQSITDDKDTALTYYGHIVASKPQNALWIYKKPIMKKIYINEFKVTIIEPELEQVIVRKISSSFDIFKLIQHAKKIGKNKYLTTYKSTDFKITTKNNLIESISYTDEFSNKIKIIFQKQKQNIDIDKKTFFPNIPTEYDIIRD